MGVYLFRLINFRLILLCACLLLLHSQGLAQWKHTEDVIYLHNGSIIRGHIIDQEIGSHIRIQVFGGSIFVFREEEIDKITIEPALYKSIVLRYRKELLPFQYRKQGLYHIASFGLGFAEGEWGLVGTPAFLYRAGYHLHHRLWAGVGSGFEFYEDGNMMIPLLLDIRGDWKQKPVTLHYFLNAGYGVVGARGWRVARLDGGLTGQAGLGLKFNTRRKSQWIFTGSYKFQQTYQEFNIWNGLPEPILVTGTLTYNRITFEMAFAF